QLAEPVHASANIIAGDRLVKWGDPLRQLVRRYRLVRVKGKLGEDPELPGRKPHRLAVDQYQSLRDVHLQRPDAQPLGVLPGWLIGEEPNDIGNLLPSGRDRNGDGDGRVTGGDVDLVDCANEDHWDVVPRSVSYKTFEVDGLPSGDDRCW